MTNAMAQLDDILLDIKQGLAHVYGPRLLGVYLYGSYARGEADDESDLDILVVLDKIASYGAEIDRTGELIAALSLHYNRSISRVFASWDAWTTGDTTFLASVRAEALAA